jgi:hypothetical protein
VEGEISEVMVTCGRNLCGDSKRDGICWIKPDSMEFRGCDLGGSSHRDEPGILTISVLEWEDGYC